MNSSFSALNPSHPLFTYLFGTVMGNERVKPLWWRCILDDSSLCVCIRKDNYINVYYLDGCIAKIEMTGAGEIIVTTHRKFLEGIDNTPVSRYYSDISDSFLHDTEKTIKQLKHNIEIFYYPDGLPEQEKFSEKYIQWKWAISHPDIVIDTEFAYNHDKDIPNLRIDIVRNDRGRLTFVELKRIGDNRMLRKDRSLQPEVITQMRKYADYISSHSEDLIDYYRKIYDIKRRIGLKVSMYKPVKAEMKPMLSIALQYNHIESCRRNRIAGITELLGRQDFFSYEFIEHE